MTSQGKGTPNMFHTVWNRSITSLGLLLSRTRFSCHKRKQNRGCPVHSTGTDDRLLNSA